MSEIINCNSCGANNQLPDGKSSMFCAYCGGKVEKQIELINQFSKIENKIKLNKINLEDYYLEYKDRGISSLEEIIQLYSDNELSDAVKLLLPNNKLTSTYGLSRFSEAEKIDLSNNLLLYIDDLPCFTKKTYLGGIIYRRIDLNFSGNNNLIDLKDDAIKKFNGSEGIESIHLDLRGNIKFNLESLGSLNFRKFINHPKGQSVNIYPPSENSILPQSLIDMGFKTNTYNFWVLSLFSQENIYKKENKKEGCFIATATMGSYDHPEVMILRNFRDKWILKRSWGNSFVKWYYYYGSIVAKSIQKSFILKKISYFLIVKPLVFISKLLIK